MSAIFQLRRGKSSRSLALSLHEARIILMDEPTSSLQREDVVHLFKLIRKLSSEGISVIYISHFLEEVRQISDRFTVLARWPERCHRRDLHID